MSRTHFLPTQRHVVVDRPRVVEKALTASPALIILRGGGGSGKSIAAIQIAKAYVKQNPEAHAVWVRFTEEQTDIEGVWGEVMLALHTSGVLEGVTTERLVEGGVPSIRAVINALTTLKNPLLIVFDDAHRNITPEVEGSILEVLEQVGDITILVTTRHTLPGLTSTTARIRVPIQKITDKQLALTQEEVEELIRARTGREDAGLIAEQIYADSRGWPLATHAIIVERESLQADDLTPIDSKHREGTFLRDYVDRLLQRADTDTVHAICAIALFHEVSTQTLADIMDIEVEEAQSLLEDTLIESLDSWVDEHHTRWYRLHELIADEVRKRAPYILDDTQLRQYAIRAARALAEVRPQAAVQAAILGKEWELLSDLLLQGSALNLTRKKQAVALTAIPKEVRSSYPVIQAFVLIHEYAFPSGAIGKVMAGMKTLASRTLAAESEKAGLPGVTAATLRMIVARLSGNDKLALAMVENVQRSLGQLTHEERVKYRAPLQTGINQTAITLLHGGEFENVTTLLGSVLEWEKELQPKSRAHAHALDAWAHAWAGHMQPAKDLIRRARLIEIPVEWHDSYIGAGYRIAATLQALEGQRYEEAREHLAATAEHEPTIEHWPFLAVAEALLVESERGSEEALGQLDRRLARRVTRNTASAYAKSMMGAFRARLLWQSGKALPHNQKRSSGDITAVYYALSKGEYLTAAGLAASIASTPHAATAPRTQTEMYLLHAEALRHHGDMKAAAAAAGRAATLMNEHALGLPIRVLPHEAALALKEVVPSLPIEHSRPNQVRAVQPLTPAEHRTLIEVVANGSVPAAAKAMYLSPSTVKGYMKNVYRKLGVNDRNEAIRVAGEAGLLTTKTSRTDTP